LPFALNAKFTHEVVSFTSLLLFHTRLCSLSSGIRHYKVFILIRESFKIPSSRGFEVAFFAHPATKRRGLKKTFEDTLEAPNTHNKF
jgi:hypothetical protein